MNITWNRVAPGEFDALVDGERNGWQVINGSHGFTGSGAANTYGIAAPNGNIKWVGKLHDAKGMAETIIRHKAKTVKA